MKHWTFDQINTIKDRIARDVQESLKDKGIVPHAFIDGVGRKNDAPALEFRLQATDLSVTTDWVEKCEQCITELIAETEDYPLMTMPYKIVVTGVKQ